jgi:hypothetical protein
MSSSTDNNTTTEVATSKSGKRIVRIRDFKFGTNATIDVANANVGKAFTNIRIKHASAKGTLVLQLDGGGSLPPFCIDKGEFGSSFVFAVTNADEVAKMCEMEEYIKECVVANRAKLFPGNTKSDAFVRDQLNAVLTKAKVTDGATFPAQAKATLDLANLKTQPGKKHPTLRIVDTDGAPVEPSDLAGRSWKRILISVNSIYIQATGSYGLSKSLSFVEVGKTKSAGGVEFSEPILMTDFVLGTSAQIGIEPIKTNDARTVMDIMTPGNCKAVLSFTKGGSLPPFVISANKFNGTNFTFTLANQAEADALRKVNVAYKKHIVANRKSLLPKFTISDTSLAESCYDIIHEGKVKEDGSSYEPSAKGSFVVPAGFNLDGAREEEEEGALKADDDKKRSKPTPVVDVSGRAVSCDALAGRKWVRVDMLLACCYLQNKSIGISKRILKIVVEDDEEDEILEPEDVATDIELLDDDGDDGGAPPAAKRLKVVV